jgi:rubredoxin
VAVSINKQNYTHQCILDSRAFGVSILAQATPMAFIGNFGFKCGREVDKFEGVQYREGKTGVPIVLDHAIACLEMETISSMDVGTHTIFVGKVVDAEILTDEEPMTYDYYHRVKRGTAPKTAPTYLKETATEQGGEMPKYRCKVCGYIYDPEKGDTENMIKPGTRFEDLPDYWSCPICGASKSEFEKV